MRSPEDELLIAILHGLDGWMLGTATNALEIARFIDKTGNRAIPRTPEAIERLLVDMLDAGLVERRSVPPDVKPRAEHVLSFALTGEGSARARELEADGPDSEGRHPVGPTLHERLEGLDTDSLRDLLRVLEMPPEGRSSLIRTLHADPRTQTMAELLMDLEGDPAALAIIVVELRILNQRNG